MVLLAAAVCCMAGGCGRKGPPLVPRSLPMPPVADLSVRTERGVAVLSWSVPRAPEAQVPDRFAVYRARLGPQACQDCPLLFEKIGAVELNAAERPLRRPWTLTWRDPVLPGWRCLYKVTSIRGRQRIADSNLAVVQP